MYLSKGEVFVKSTLSSIPTYFMFILQVLASITGNLERLERKFLWGSADGAIKFHLINSETIMVKVGEMTVEVWDRGHALWREVTGKKYGIIKRGWRTENITVLFGCSI